MTTSKTITNQLKIKKTFILIFLIFIAFNSCSSKPKAIVTRKEKSDKDLSILCMGDIILVRQAEEYMEINGKDYPFIKIKSEIDKYDIVTANLEMPITYRGRAHATKPFTFRLHPDYAIHLKQLKIDLFTLANNHILDFGNIGMTDTISFIEKWGVKHTGAGKNLTEARKPAVFNHKNTEIFFLSYCERPPDDFYATSRSPGTAKLKLNLIHEDIKKYKKHDNLVLISLHWGIEHNDYPDKYQVRIAHSIIDAGADAIIGHHPHVPQGIEIYNSKPIIYSLGNAIISFYNKNYKNNIMVSLNYKGNNIKSLKIIPLASKYENIKSQPYIFKGEEAQKILNHVKYISRPFKTEIIVNENTATVPIY